MIEINFSKKFSVSIDFTFFAVIALFLSFDNSGYGLMSIAACFIHESGHLIAMFIEKKLPERITFYGGGIKLNSTSQPSVFILLAGSMTNFVLFAVLYYCSGRTDIFPVLFAVINLVIGLFNLMPIGFFDGKRLLEIAFIRVFEPVKAMYILGIIESVLLFLIICSTVLMFIGGYINFTMVIVLIYLIFIDIIDRL